MNFEGIGRERKICYKALKEKELWDFLKFLIIFEYFPQILIFFDFFATIFLFFPFDKLRTGKNMREICYWERRGREIERVGKFY